MNNLSFIIETKELMHALTFANSVVEKRNVTTELSHVKMVVADNNLELIATDMDLYLSQNIGAQVLKEGQITVSTQTLTDIVRKIPDKEIKFILNEEQLEISGKNCQFNLLTLPVEKFPNIELNDFELALKLASVEFARLIDSTQFSMSTEETRYNLNGIYLHIKNNKLWAASTDGHRLSVSSTPLDHQTNKEFGVILPRKTVQEIAKIVKDQKNAQQDIEIMLGTNKIKFVCNGLFMISKLIDGTFPEYESFIPVDNQNRLVMDTKLLASAIDRVATITVDKFRAIKLNITTNGIEITASGEAKGAAKEFIFYSSKPDELCEFKGNELAIGFNPKYLIDVLNSIKHPQVELELNDSSSPAVIKALSNLEDKFVVMPVKV